MFTNATFIFWLGVLVTVEQAVAGGTIHLTHMVPDDWIPTITAWCAFLSFVGTALMTGLTGFSSSRGPFTGSSLKSPPPAIIALLLVPVVLLALTACATAQTPTPKPKPPLAQIGSGAVGGAATGGQVAVAPKSGGTPLQRLMDEIANVKKELVDGIINDLTAADADAATVDPQTNQMRDAIAHACYPAQIKFLQSLPAAQPLVGKFVAIQLHQRVRDFTLQIKQGLPTYLKLGCAPMIGDDIQIVVQTLGLVGVQVAGTALTGGALPMLPLPLPLPGL